MDGVAHVAETTYTPIESEAGAAPVRLIVRRVKPTPGSQLTLLASYSYHGFITDRDGEMLELEADHRPSGRFCANAAWLASQAMAHNLARWTRRITLSE